MYVSLQAQLVKCAQLTVLLKSHCCEIILSVYIAAFCCSQTHNRLNAGLLIGNNVCKIRNKTSGGMVSHENNPRENGLLSYNSKCVIPLILHSLMNDTQCLELHLMLWNFHTWAPVLIYITAAINIVPISPLTFFSLQKISRQNISACTVTEKPKSANCFAVLTFLLWKTYRLLQTIVETPFVKVKVYG